MKDKVIDLVYNWKHGLSSENTKGTRGIVWLVFIVCVSMFLVGIVGTVIGIITHAVPVLVLSLVVFVGGIAFFLWMSAR